LPFRNHVWIISELLNGLKANEQGAFLLLKYVTGASSSKMLYRLRNRALSKHFTSSLKQSSPSKFTEDHQIASSGHELEQDKIFLSILHMVQFSKPIPNLLKQAYAAKCGQSFELYNETTQMEFHTVLCELLEQYEKSLDDLVNYPASKPNFNSPKTYRETLLMAVGIGDTLHHLTRTAAIKKHLQALESCLDDLIRECLVPPRGVRSTPVYF